MSLPKIQQPIYQLNLISNPKKKISYRPFLVKEDIILLQAAESQDSGEMSSATRQIVNNCVLDEDFDCLNIPIFDVDYIYMNIRAKSVGDKIEQVYSCNNQNTPDGVKCTHQFTLSFNLNDVEIVNNNSEKKIFITPEMGLVMKYPTYSSALLIDSTDSEMMQTLKTIYHSIDYSFDKEQTHSMKDTSFEEFQEFINSLTLDQYEKITNFLENIPSLKLSSSHTCEKCGFIHTITVEDPASFF